MRTSNGSSAAGIVFIASAGMLMSRAGCMRRKRRSIRSCMRIIHVLPRQERPLPSCPIWRAIDAGAGAFPVGAALFANQAFGISLLDEYLTGKPRTCAAAREKLNVQAVELGADLSMTLQVAECSDSSLVIRKYVVADEPQVFKAYVQFALVFAYKAFGRLPDRIEIYALMNGSAYAFRPKEEHYHSSLDFVRLMLGVMNEGLAGSGLYH